MPSVTEPLTAFLERKFASNWASLAVTHGTSERIDEIRSHAVGDRTPADLASIIADIAEADARATHRCGPYFVWVCRSTDPGVTPFERFPLSFDDCAPSESNERASLLATQRELAIRQTQAQVELHHIALEASRLVVARHDREVDRAEAYATRMDQALASERAHSMGMAHLLFAATKESVAAGQASVAAGQAASAALLQGDERRRALIAETRNQQVFAAVASNLDVLIPAIASGWMKANGAGGNPEMMAEFQLIQEFFKSLTKAQFIDIGALLPQHLQMGIMEIYEGKMAAPLIPAATAKIFAQIDGRMAAAIYEKLDPAESDPTNIVQKMDADGKPMLNEEGHPIMCPAEKQSRQQTLFAQLWKTKENTMLARGEAAQKVVFGG